MSTDEHFVESEQGDVGEVSAIRTPRPFQECQPEQISDTEEMGRDRPRVDMSEFDSFPGGVRQSVEMEEIPVIEPYHALGG